MLPFGFVCKSRKENPQKLAQLSSRSHPRHLVGKSTAQKDTIIDITSDSQVNSNFPYRRSSAGLTFNNNFYLFLYLYLKNLPVHSFNALIIPILRDCLPNYFLVALLLAVPRRLFCFGSLVILDVARCMVIHVIYKYQNR